MSHAATNALFTDLYELTMAAGYFHHAMHHRATFSLFLRAQPQRGYYVAAGLEPALRYLERLCFESEEIDYLRQSGRFNDSFLDYLQNIKFEGDVWALSEGALFFPDEPILEITAPLIQAQIVETFLINTIGLYTLLATKASRCVHAAQGRALIEFGSRRTQGEAAAMAAARGAYQVGYDATSNVLAAKQYGIPVAGTMAHSFVQSFDKEMEAFLAYAQTFPDAAILLIDTYDTIGGAHAAVAVGNRLKANGHQLVGVRIDSGDMVVLSRQVRSILDEAGLGRVKIFASGGFDEFSIAEAVARNAPIDAFGVGTMVGVSADLPYLDLVYKMVRYKDRDVLKRSPGKETLPGKKQVFRCLDQRGSFAGDTIGTRKERYDNDRPLLDLVMEGGRSCKSLPAIDEVRGYHKKQFRCLPDQYKALTDPPVYPVKISPVLKAGQKKLLL